MERFQNKEGAKCASSDDCLNNIARLKKFLISRGAKSFHHGPISNLSVHIQTRIES